MTTLENELRRRSKWKVTDKHIHSWIIGLHRNGNSLEIISLITDMPIGEVDKVVKEYFKNVKE